MYTSSLSLALVAVLSLGASLPKANSMPTLVQYRAANSNSNATAAGAPCAAAEDQLATGIQQNINDQLGENGSVTAIASLLKAGNVNQAQFLTAKSQLLSFVTAGISVRENNQAIAPANNAAIPGLAIVASAQQQELALSSQLVGDPAQDNAVVTQLLSDFAGGIKQNKENLANATAGCTPSNAQAAATLASLGGAAGKG